MKYILALLCFDLQCYGQVLVVRPNGHAAVKYTLAMLWSGASSGP
jgi:hypothetical protein